MVVQYKGEGPTSALRQADVINKRLDGLIRKMDDPNLSSKDRMKLDREFDLLQRNFDKIMGLKKEGGKIDISPRMIGMKKIRKKIKELDKRISGADSPIKKSKLSKDRDKAIKRIDSRIKMKNFGFGTKSGVAKKRDEFLKTGKTPKTISGSIVSATKKLGGIKKAGGKVTKMRGGGLARSGAASLSGYKVR